MITRLRAKNYGCLKNVEIELTPVHAFIGPNDSGKSTLLRAVRALGYFAAAQFARDAGGWLPFDPGISQGLGVAETFLGVSTTEGYYHLEFSADGTVEKCDVLESGKPMESARRDWGAPSIFHQAGYERLQPVLAGLRFARLLRLDPDALRSPSGLIPHTESVHFLNERGLGLPGVYQAILGRGDEAFGKIREAVRSLFPTIKRVGVLPITSDKLILEAELTDGKRILAEEMSEGLLYYLAFAAIPYLNPTSVLLVEEPENGMHPARVAQVVQILRAFGQQTNTQVLIATHSPLVIDELTADEVTVLTRPSAEEGTRAIPIKETHNFEERAGVYSLGELWLSYSDGDQEEPMFNPRLR